METNLQRRQLLTAALGGVVAVTDMPRPASVSAASTGALPLRTVIAGPLEIAYADLGPADGYPVILLHGWPYDIHSFVEVAPCLARAGCRVLVPYLRGFGATKFLSKASKRNGQPAAIACDTIAMMDALGLRSAILAGFDWGARSANIIAALWPGRCRGLVSVSGYLISGQATGRLPLKPAAELQWWYQFYFATERGREGYARYRKEFAQLIWQLASPKWQFQQDVFDQSAAAFENADHVDVVVHNYRWRQGLAKGDRLYNPLESLLAKSPAIRVPTITLEGDANGAPHPAPSSYTEKFLGHYEHREIQGGIGHNLPQEAPAAFVRAVLDIRDHDLR
jgi:pimeloyl-ACP methyl ester carboxylesterase